MLEGKHIAILIEEDFEDSVLAEPLRAMQDAGAIWVDEPVVKDGNIITARKPADLPKFNKAIIEALA
jgi:putative intracellular protease/amidase